MMRVGVKVYLKKLRAFCDLGVNHLISLSISFFICTKEIILTWSAS